MNDAPELKASHWACLKRVMILILFKKNKERKRKEDTKALYREIKIICKNPNIH